MASSVRLPRADGSIRVHTVGPAADVPAAPGPITSRIGFAAVHVVADPLADINPTLDVKLDWDATLAYRRYLWSLGLAVAEAMDTAQRGMGLPWSSARELIARTVAEARTVAGAVVFSGAGTDDLLPSPTVTLAQVETAYDAQCGDIESVGGRIILMASRALAACARGPEDYAKVYGRLLTQVKEPVIIHWLGDMFDPALAGYWGSPDLDRATETLLAIVHEHAAKIDGVKISLLAQHREIAMRRRFPSGVRMYTGDDFDYPTTIAGDEHGHSDALLADDFDGDGHAFLRQVLVNRAIRKPKDAADFRMGAHAHAVCASAFDQLGEFRQQTSVADHRAGATITPSKRA